MTEENIEENIKEIVEEPINQIAALNHYKAHRLAVKKYTDANRTQINERNRIYYNKVMSDPEKHEKYKETRRNAYKAKKEKKEN